MFWSYCIRLSVWEVMHSRVWVNWSSWIFTWIQLKTMVMSQFCIFFCMTFVNFSTVVYKLTLKTNPMFSKALWFPFVLLIYQPILWLVLILASVRDGSVVTVCVITEVTKLLKVSVFSIVVIYKCQRVSLYTVLLGAALLTNCLILRLLNPFHLTWCMIFLKGLSQRFYN